MPVKSLVCIGGEPKANKSYVVLNMCLDLARGRDIFGGKYHDGSPAMPVAKPYRVLYIEQEIGEEGLKERLLPMLSGEVPYGLDFYIKSRDMTMRLDTPEGRLAIEQQIVMCKPDIVVFDPLAEFQLINENSAQEMGMTVRVLKRWIESYGISIILVHHVGKPGFEDPRTGGNKLRGSSALFGAVDTFIGVSRKSESSHPAPTLELEFELRRGKPLQNFTIRREESGLVTFLGDKWTAGLVQATHNDGAETAPRAARQRKPKEPEPFAKEL
jgi:hypothetical protein